MLGGLRLLRETVGEMWLGSILGWGDCFEGGLVGELFRYVEDR